jgi:transcriptional regulator GlxA family with amidase domain
MNQTNKSTAVQKYYRQREVAGLLSISRQTVERRFRQIPGVIFDGRMEGTRLKRRYAMMLIPESAIEEYLAALPGM